MKRIAVGVLLCVWCLAVSVAAGGDDDCWQNLTCRPVNGYIELPGITFDDMTPLARDAFKGNPAAVTNALYSLPYEEREDFMVLYLEPNSREKHRIFFARCREISERRALDAKMGDGDVIPPQLRRELLERERVRLALHEGAIPFRLGTGILYIPIPSGYSVMEGPLPGFANDPAVSNALVSFKKADVPVPGEERVIRKNMMATVKHVREGADNLSAMLRAYRIMVDETWRLTGIYPPEASPETAETVEYKWNVQPFNVRDNSFCYGQFEKTVDFHGVEEIRYRVTGVVMVGGSYVQVSVSQSVNTDLDTVGEMNTDLVRWRDAIISANY